MGFIGKIIGVFLGWKVGGFFGAIAGLILGSIADKKLFLTVNTLDGQYVDLLFYNCNVKIEDIS